MAVGKGYDVVSSLDTPVPVINEVGRVVISPNGQYDWQLQQPSFSLHALYGVAASNAGVVVVGGDGVIFFSDNASNWVSVVSPASTTIRSVAYGNATFIAVGDKIGSGDSDPGLILKSTNGITWTDVSSSSITVNNLTNVYYNLDLDKFLLVGDNQTIIETVAGRTF